MKYIIISLLLFFSKGIFAQDFVYQPVNPAFGGNYLNYSWLMSSAQAQNKLQAADQQGGDLTGAVVDNPLQDFTTNLNRQILNNLSQVIISQQFGLTSLKDGSYTVGSYQIDISTGVDGISLIITDFVNGGQTSIIIPHF